jgi:hypothetical protein
VAESLCELMVLQPHLARAVVVDAVQAVVCPTMVCMTATTTPTTIALLTPLTAANLALGARFV